MAYEVIARKWRPKNFNELIGQSHVSQTLINALKNDRLPQALLLNGPRGTGKTSTARIFASTLRCTDIKDFQPCGVCHECVEVGKGKSVNVIEVDGASNNGVDSIRELRDSVSYMPSSGKYKVYIIDEVHMLSTSAFNALLKTLEEPPPHVVFIMATTEIHKIPNTILSRCQKFDFRRVSCSEIVQSLEKICKAENISYESEALWNIARQGDGSIRDSQSLLDQVISFCDNNIQAEQTIEALGLTDRKWIVKTLEYFCQRNTSGVLEILKILNQSGLDSNLFVKDLLQEVRNTLICKLNPEIAHSIIDLSQVAIEELTQMSALISAEDWHLIFDLILKGANDVIKASDSADLVLEMLLLRTCLAPRIKNIESSSLPVMPPRTSVPVQELVTPEKTVSPSTPAVHPSHSHSLQNNQPPAPKHAEAHQQSQKPAPTPPQITQQTETSQQDQKPSVAQVHPPQPVNKKTSNQETWLSLVTKIKKMNPVLAAKLEHSHLLNIDGQELTIGISKNIKFLSEQVKEKDFNDKLQNYVSTLWGKRYTFNFKTMDEKKNMNPSELKEYKAIQADEELKQKVAAHPFIKKASELLKTEITSIKDI